MRQPTTITQKLLAGLAMILSLVAYFPQLIRIIQRKSAEDISYLFLSFVAFASLLWVAYAGLRHDMMMMVAYMFGFMMTTSILALKFYYEKFADPKMTKSEPLP
jgi:MtN3 and saliva related transmembrane protein